MYFGQFLVIGCWFICDSNSYFANDTDYVSAMMDIRMYINVDRSFPFFIFIFLGTGNAGCQSFFGVAGSLVILGSLFHSQKETK